MTSIVVFLGPTLSHDGARRVLDAEYLPPAGHGDVLSAALRRPTAIGIVDGVFERVPAIWHKEILFALSEGVPVYGAASMGALRAAELDVFGMRGVGEVYRAYADGTLEDDDEVAVAHADAEHRFRATSDAMVDVRATLAAAVDEGVIGEPTAATILARVKATFYADRLLVGALDRGHEEHERLRAWLPEGFVRRKQDDALELLRTIGSDVTAERRPVRPEWTLQHTHYWEEARRGVERGAGASWATPVGADDADLEAVLDEVRLDPAGYALLLDRALLAALARRAATAAGVDASAWARQSALEEDRRQRGLLEPDEVDAWLGDRGLGRSDLPVVADRLAALRWARGAHRDAVAGEVALTVRSDDAYAELAARATRKRAVLDSLAASEQPRIDDAELVEWYFGTLGQEVPAALDTWAAAFGWRRLPDFLRALRAEWRFRAVKAGAD